MGFICVTNNKMLYEKYKDNFEIKFFDAGFKEILIKTRDMVHLGHTILTHPLSGSVKPNETPVKTVFVSRKKGELDYESLVLIENSIITFDKFLQKPTNNNTRKDFYLVDLSLAESTFPSLLI